MMYQMYVHSQDLNDMSLVGFKYKSELVPRVDDRLKDKDGKLHLVIEVHIIIEKPGMINVMCYTGQEDIDSEDDEPVQSDGKNLIAFPNNKGR